MDIPADLLPAASLWIAAFVYATLLAAAGLTAPWGKILDKEGSNIFFGAVAFIAVVCVITSYSIHYTKLYDPGDLCGVSGSGHLAAQPDVEMRDQ